jgi:hypothetical protein
VGKKFNEWSKKTKILKAILCAGLTPNVCQIEMPKKFRYYQKKLRQKKKKFYFLPQKNFFRYTAHGALREIAKVKELRFFLRSGQQVRFKKKKFQQKKKISR